MALCRAGHQIYIRWCWISSIPLMISYEQTTRNTLCKSSNYWSKTPQRQHYLKHTESHSRIGHWHHPESPYSTTGPQGKNQLPSKFFQPWITQMLILPLTPPTWKLLEHSTHHYRSCRHVSPDSARAEDGQWMPDFPICHCPHIISYFLTMKCASQMIRITLNTSKHYWRKKTPQSKRRLEYRKIILRWAIDTIQQIPTLPPDRRDKFSSLLYSITLGLLRLSQCQW